MPEDELDREDHRQRRTCLRCDKTFPSDGPGNRICPACRRVLDAQSPGPEPVPRPKPGKQ
jgi:hypothetical protein